MTRYILNIFQQIIKDFLSVCDHLEHYALMS